MLKHTYKRPQPTIKDPNRVCVICGADYIAVAPLQKTCSSVCRKAKNVPQMLAFKLRHPDKSKIYTQNRIAKNPNIWREKANNERLKILDALGGKCIVCGADNKNWLHVDYKPGMRGTGYRHPRHFKWIMDNISDFRILCANHHYELTLTGKIEGSDITQEINLPTVNNE